MQPAVAYRRLVSQARELRLIHLGGREVRATAAGGELTVSTSWRRQ
jgi:hypothetical protein